MIAAHAHAAFERALVERERAKLRLAAVHQARAYALELASPRDVRAAWTARCAYHQASLVLWETWTRYTRWHQATHRARVAA